MPRAEPPERGPNLAECIAAVRSELAAIRASLERTERTLSEFEVAAVAQPARNRPDRYLQVLVGIYDSGGRHGVDADTLAAIGDRHGYSRRGLGGFFTGARAPLERSGDRVRLTVEGERLVDGWLRGLAP
jgi:hypothetical protein